MGQNVNSSNSQHQRNNTDFSLFYSFLVDLVNDGVNKREVQSASVEGFAAANGVSISNCFETSAKDGTNVDTLFEAVARVYDGNSSDYSDEEDLVDLAKNKSGASQQKGGSC